MTPEPLDPAADYRSVNQANWDDRAPLHARSPGYAVDRLVADRSALSDVVAFDRERLGPLDGLDVVHLQCHIGTDTVSLARLGARSVTGVDLSGASLTEATEIARRAGAQLELVHSDVYDAPAALGGRTFDLVYTGIGAIGWLPSITRWAAVVAELLRPGGRLFIREGHPVLFGSVAVTLRDAPAEAAEQSFLTGADGVTIALELPYFEHRDPTVWTGAYTYVETDQAPAAIPAMEWSHGLGEILTALLDQGLVITTFVEHDSVPWAPFPELMHQDEHGEWRLKDRPDRMPLSYTLIAHKPEKP
ncbi:class I SAM-dependent methyltransferase [Arsenicicoccus piscis]|uniref:Methyltransferase n=1 Tax=Arsenicicoccus piscis TaxID=673954 RepID=A0ABQ6HTN6_9MICO|nr:class I SAM-dependent methyltransferase [Arsenicicoccus piscis]GMA21895.1 methyltransferase [Arsenicicoccus piscis]